MSWLACMNEMFKNYASTLNALDKLIGIAISAGLFWLAHRANGIAKSNLELANQEQKLRQYRIDKDGREIFREIYKNLKNAIVIVFREGRVNEEAFSLFWKARDQAQLELPDDIQEYVSNLFMAAKKAHDINSIYLYPEKREGLPVGEERSKRVNEHEEQISIIINAQPHEHFAKYMKVKTA